MKFITYLNGEIDTLKPIFSGRPDKIETVKMKATNNVLKGKLFPNENLIVTFTEPIFSFDTTLIRAFDKDANQLNLPRIKSQVRELMFDVQETSVFEIRIDSAAVTSLYKRSNESQIKVLFDCLKDDYYGNLIVNVDSVFAESGIIQLLNMKSELIKEVTLEKQMTFNNLLPGDYQIRLILDADANGKWSEGNMSTFTEPEKVIYYSGTAKVKSKWDKEIDWIFSK
jgi:hypothetical protein